MKKLTALTISVIFALTLLTGCTPASDDKPSGDGGASTKNPTTGEVWDAVSAKVGEDFLNGLMDADKDTVMNLYGINTDDLEEYVVKVPMINVRADEYFIAKVKEGKMEDVKKGIEKRKTDLDEQWKQYLPDIYEQVKAAQTVVNGNYIFFVIGEKADDAVAGFNEVTK